MKAESRKAQHVNGKYSSTVWTFPLVESEVKKCIQRLLLDDLIFSGQTIMMFYAYFKLDFCTKMISHIIHFRREDYKVKSLQQRPALCFA